MDNLIMQLPCAKGTSVSSFQITMAARQRILLVVYVCGNCMASGWGSEANTCLTRWADILFKIKLQDFSRPLSTAP